MITFFHARYHYLNTTLPRFYHHLSSVPRPGVRVVDVTEAGERAVAEAAAASRVVVVDASIVAAAIAPDVNRHPTFHIVGHQARGTEYYAAILDRLLEAPAALALMAYGDLHDGSAAAAFARFSARGSALLWLFEQAPATAAEVPEHYREPGLTDVDAIVERWRELTRAFPVRVDCWFSLAEEELERRPARARWDVCIAGAPYRTRLIARESVRAAGLSEAPFRQVSRGLVLAGRVAGALPRREALSRGLIALSVAGQRAVVSRSRTAFVCGGGLRYPVRKFLEVPAAGVAMLALPCQGFGNYGFEDGVNALACTPEDTGAAARRLLGDPALRERIAAAGWETVRRLHSMRKRADDVVECMRRLGQGTLRNARFVDGRFEITG